MSGTSRRYLLDTHTFLWMAGDPNRLGPRAREEIESSAVELLLSVASLWEMATKSSLGKLSLGQPLGDFLRDQLAATRTVILEVRSEHAIRVESLPWHHRDPFDLRSTVVGSREGDFGGPTGRKPLGNLHSGPRGTRETCRH